MSLQFKDDKKNCESKISQDMNRFKGKLFIMLKHIKSLVKMDTFSDTDAYVQFQLSTDIFKKQIKTSKIIENNNQPVFDEEIEMQVDLL